MCGMFVHNNYCLVILAAMLAFSLSPHPILNCISHRVHDRSFVIISAPEEGQIPPSATRFNYLELPGWRQI